MLRTVLLTLALCAGTSAIACKGLSPETCAELDRRNAAREADLNMMQQTYEMQQQTRELERANNTLDAIEWNTRRRRPY